MCSCTYIQVWHFILMELDQFRTTALSVLPLLVDLTSCSAYLAQVQPVLASGLHQMVKELMEDQVTPLPSSLVMLMILGLYQLNLKMEYLWCQEIKEFTVVSFQMKMGMFIISMLDYTLEDLTVNM